MAVATGAGVGNNEPPTDIAPTFTPQAVITSIQQRGTAPGMAMLVGAVGGVVAMVVSILAVRTGAAIFKRWQARFDVATGGRRLGRLRSQA